MSCKKFSAIQDLIFKIQLKRASIGCVSSGDMAMYRCIISIAVKVDAMSPNDIPKWKHV